MHGENTKDREGHKRYDSRHHTLVIAKKKHPQGDEYACEVTIYQPGSALVQHRTGDTHRSGFPTNPCTCVWDAFLGVMIAARARSALETFRGGGLGIRIFSMWIPESSSVKLEE
jgi:hypothetical protein